MPLFVTFYDFRSWWTIVESHCPFRGASFRAERLHYPFRGASFRAERLLCPFRRASFRVERLLYPFSGASFRAERLPCALRGASFRAARLLCPFRGASFRAARFLSLGKYPKSDVFIAQQAEFISQSFLPREASARISATGKKAFSETQTLIKSNLFV